MLEIAKFVNHLNQTIEFGSGGVFISDSEMHNYEWEYDDNFDEITNFHKGITPKKMKIIIMAASEEEGINIRNRIFEVFERDVLAEKPGRFYQDGYYMTGYFIASQKSKWYISKRYMEQEVTMVTDQPDWIRESLYSYLITDDIKNVAGNVKKYSYQYVYRYKNQNSSSRIMNNAVIDSDFIFRIYGPVANPLIMVNNHVYQVNVSINIGEYVEINSQRKTIYLIHNNGSSDNVFWSAAKQGYIFEKIPSGQSVVAWDGKFAFDLIIIEKRSEKAWR